MKTSTADERRRIIGGACLMAAPLSMLAADVLRAGAGMRYESHVVLKLCFAFFIPAILALVHLLRERADRAGLVGGGLAIVGCLSGSAIVTVSFVRMSLETAALGEPTMRAVEDALVRGGVPGFLFLFPLPGLAFPAGLLVLGAGLLWARAVPAPAAMLLMLGAVLFPVGRIGGIEAVVLASSVALSASMGWAGWRVLNRAAAAKWEGADRGRGLAEELPA